MKHIINDSRIQKLLWSWLVCAELPVAYEAFLLDGNGGMNIKIYHWPKLFILV